MKRLLGLLLWFLAGSGVGVWFMVILSTLGGL